jgi:hypothetical protein
VQAHGYSILKRFGVSFIGRFGPLCVGALCAGLLLCGPVAAKSPKLISGKLSGPGYTVIAVAADGTASTVRAGRGSFALRPTARSVTLHLRGPDGVYAGPVIIRGLGNRAILGVRAGARLGTITVHPSHGRLARRLARRWIAARYVARARKSVPIGAGKFGRVRSKPPRSRVPGDLDRDGVPNPLDIEDDGDKTLDNLDRTPRGRVRARSAQAAGDLGRRRPIQLFRPIPFAESASKSELRKLTLGPT